MVTHGQGVISFLKGGIMRSFSRFACNSKASAAIEFAFCAPLLVLVAFGIISYGSIMATYNGVQQLAAESARASVPGLSDTERDQLARNFITSSIASYPFLDSSRLVVTTSTLSTPVPSFKVSLSYDMSHSVVYTLRNIVPLPASQINRSAIVQRGGF